MEAPYILISEIHPKISAPTDLAEELFKYAEDFFKSAHIITEFILYAEHPDIGKLDTYFLVIAFLYRHCMEVGLKAIGFQYINDIEERRKFVKGTRHNLSAILNVVENKCNSTRPDEEIEWLKKYFNDLSKIDRESDSFRYPFHIVWEQDEWKELELIFIEAGGFYYAQSVVDYKYSRAEFYPYTKAYLETANYLKWYMKNETDLGNLDCKNHLFLPMCYLYRNCVELSLKAIWFEDIGEDFQIKCKFMLDKKHSVAGMWKKLKPYILEYSKGTDEPEYIEVIEDYCVQVHPVKIL